MSDCCTPGTGFPNAALMQQMALNNSTVWTEICMLQQAVLAAASQCQPGGGKMCTTVGGTTPMTFVSGVSSIAVVDPGAGYFQDSPGIRFIPPVGSTATGASATIETNGSSITGINLVAGGTGYQPRPATLSVSSVAGTGAELQPLVNAAGQIVSVNIVNPGTGYTTADSVIATRAVVPDPNYVNATFVISAVSLTGEILSVVVTNMGSGYQDSVTTVEVVSTLNPIVPYPLGTGFIANVLTDNAGTITGTVITNSGAGYATYSPYLTISDPGTGAVTRINLSADTVGSVDVISGGSNYTQTATGTVFNPSTAVLPNPPATPAVVTVNVSNNTYGTNPVLYWQVWAGVTTDKQISLQLNSVISYFKGLGYTITIQTNPSSPNTIQWLICW